MAAIIAVVRITKTIIMNHKLDIFSFNTAQLATATRGRYRAVQPYECLTLESQANAAYVVIELPFDARIEDSIELVLTKRGARGNSCALTYQVDAESYLSKVLSVNIATALSAGEYVMQINLLGLNNFLKNTVEFNVRLASDIHRIASTRPAPKRPSGLKRFFNSAFSAVLSVF